MTGYNIITSKKTSSKDDLTKTLIPELSELKVFGKDWNTKDGTCIRDYIHVMDLADGHVLSLENILNNKFKYEITNNFLKLQLIP